MIPPVYFDLGPSDVGELTRREICLNLEEMGFEIEASHHECATAQHEIDFRYDEAVRSADNIMTFKMVVKSIASFNHLCATFMPKPVFGEAGSGMHINMSLFKDGKNAFCDPEGPKGLSTIALQFIAGIMKHVKGICALTNPLVNSYKRLVPGYEAPCYIAWTASNRSALVRVPATRGKRYPRRAAQPRSLRQPLSPVRCAAGRWSGRHQRGPDSAARCFCQYLRYAGRRASGGGH